MKKIILSALILFILISCGRKGPPIYEDPEETENQTKYKIISKIII